MKLNIRDMEAETDEVAENNFLNLLEISTKFGEEEKNQLFQWVRPFHLDIEDGNPDLQSMHMFEKQTLMLSEFYLKKFIVKVLVKIRGTHFNPLLLLDPLLILVLNIVVDEVLMVFLLQVMMAQEERGPIMVVILKMMVGILLIHNKVNIHWAHSLVKMILHMLHKMKTTGLGESVQVLEPLESHIEEYNEG